jgi:hypothetical protein
VWYFHLGFSQCAPSGKVDRKDAFDAVAARFDLTIVHLFVAFRKILDWLPADEPAGSWLVSMLLLRHPADEEAMARPAGGTRLRMKQGNNANAVPDDNILQAANLGLKRWVSRGIGLLLANSFEFVGLGFL